MLPEEENVNKERLDENIEQLSKAPVAKKEEPVKGANWPLTAASKNQALNGVPGYVVVSDNFGKAVQLKVDNINVDLAKLDVSKHNLKGELRITGRTPVQ